MQMEEKRREKDERDNSCTICYEPLFQNGVDGQTHLKNCSCVLHLDCIRPHIEALLQRNQLEFTCPNANCLKIISPSDLNQILTLQEMNRYNNISVSKAVDGDKDMCWCFTPGCTYAFINDQADRFSCPICNKDYCVNCKVEFHVN